MVPWREGSGGVPVEPCWAGEDALQQQQEALITGHTLGAGGRDWAATIVCPPEPKGWSYSCQERSGLFLLPETAQERLGSDQTLRVGPAGVGRAAITAQCIRCS
jgi:hypothetical protein